MVKKFCHDFVTRAYNEVKIKINFELEQLSVEELENVAGGIIHINNRNEQEPDANIENQNKILHVR